MSPDPFLSQSQDRGGPQMPQLKANQRLFNDRYELLQLLGAGGMGVVWLARDHTEEVDVALKFLPSVLVLQDGEMKRLRDEVRAGKDLRHPRLVATYGMEMEHGIAAIILEFVRGQTLRQKLEDQTAGFFEPEEITAWVKDMTDGLDYLHEEARRIHRDLKPANVMVDAAGRVKLMDFGISHRIKEEVSKHSKTGEGAASASSSTLAYASPQQISGRPGSKADDIYSLGATLYELLTGTPPFFRGGPDAVNWQIREEAPTPIMERRQELMNDGLNRGTGRRVDSRISQIVMACLAKEREKRPGSVTAVWQSFKAAEEPIAAAIPVVDPEVQRAEEARKAAEAQKLAAAQEEAAARKRAELERKSRLEAEARQRRSQAHQQPEQKPKEGGRFARTAAGERPRHTSPQAESRPPGIHPDRMTFLWASFAAIFASGVGFAIHAGNLGKWVQQYHLSASQLGTIGSMGFSGFCLGILAGGMVVDKLGYGRLVRTVFFCHVASAIATLSAGTFGSAYSLLVLGTFLFSYANGTLEAVSNPLVSTLFPENRTHYLNVLHASWPAGMLVGGMTGWMLNGMAPWQFQSALFLVPTALYAFMFFDRKFPKSEAVSTGRSFAQMLKPVGILGALPACGLLVMLFKDIGKAFTSDEVAAVGYSVSGFLLIGVTVLTQGSRGSLLLFVLFIAHAFVGVMELGSEGWIQNIMSNLLSPWQLKLVLIWTSVISIGLRFCAGFIEAKLRLSPVGLLLICAGVSCIGLSLVSTMQTFVVVLIAMGIYSIGKSLLWPTMLAVVGDRFPQTGAVTMSIMGAIGMLSVGLIGGPGLSYCKDRFAGEELKRADPALFSEYRAAKPNTFLDISATAVYGLDDQKLNEARFSSEKSQAQQAVVAADQKADRATLRMDAVIPAIVAAIYLALLLFFKVNGGYKAIRSGEAPA